MEHIKHIKELPDTYVGSSILEEKELFVYDNGKIQKKNINWVPGLYKCFDEALVNARDHAIRMELSKEKKKHLVKNMSQEHAGI